MIGTQRAIALQMEGLERVKTNAGAMIGGSLGVLAALGSGAALAQVMPAPQPAPVPSVAVPASPDAAALSAMDGGARHCH